MEEYRIPKHIYDKAMADLLSPPETTQNDLSQRRLQCLDRVHTNRTLRTPLTNPALLETVKLAFEKRDWKNLYLILLQCLKTNKNLIVHETLQVR